MEKALLNGELLLATEVSNDYQLEKQVRRKSNRLLLRCPDPNCPNPILRYCHGEVRGAYFAHLQNCRCDYAEYDQSMSPQLRDIKNALFLAFKEKGFLVQQEMKLLPHHYTHLTFSIPKYPILALELGTLKTTFKQLDALSIMYKSEKIPVRWIVVDDPYKIRKENEASFLKRYILNESSPKGIVILGWDCQTVTQYIVDPNKYEYNGESFFASNFRKIYFEHKTISELTIEDGEITIDGFEERCRQWLSEKKERFNKYIQDVESRLQKAKIRREEVRGSRDIAEKNRQIELPKPPESVSLNEESLRRDLVENEDSVYQNGWQVRLCLHCNKIKRAVLFDPYIIYEKSYNLGCCKTCKKDNVPKKCSLGKE